MDQNESVPPELLRDAFADLEFFPKIDLDWERDQGWRDR